MELFNIQRDGIWSGTIPASYMLHEKKTEEVHEDF